MNSGHVVDIYADNGTDLRNSYVAPKVKVLVRRPYGSIEITIDANGDLMFEASHPDGVTFRTQELDDLVDPDRELDYSED